VSTSKTWTVATPPPSVALATLYKPKLQISFFLQTKFSPTNSSYRLVSAKKLLRIFAVAARIMPSDDTSRVVERPSRRAHRVSNSTASTKVSGMPGQNSSPPGTFYNMCTDLSGWDVTPDEPFPAYSEPVPAYDEPEPVPPGAGSPSIPSFSDLMLQARQSLGEGGGIDVYLGEKWLFKVPVKLFMALTTAASKIDKSNPSQPRLYLPSGLSPQAFLYVYEWLKTLCTATTSVPIKKRDIAAEDMAVCRAARLLGMEEYAQHIFDYYWAHFQNDFPTYEEMAAVETMAETAEKLKLGQEDDGLVFFHCIAKNIGYKAFHKTITNLHELVAFMCEHPKLEGAIVEIMKGLEGEQSSSLRSLNPSAVSQQDDITFQSSAMLNPEAKTYKPKDAMPGILAMMAQKHAIALKQESQLYRELMASGCTSEAYDAFIRQQRESRGTFKSMPKGWKLPASFKMDLVANKEADEHGAGRSFAG
jgi:hypothetical protein